MTSRDDFKAALTKLGLTEPVPLEIKKLMVREKKNAYIAILQQQKKYTPFTAIAVQVMFFLRSLHFDFSLRASSLLLSSLGLIPLLFVGVLLIPMTPAKPENLVLYINGEISVMRHNRLRLAGTRDEIRSGDEISTGKKSVVSMLISGDAVISLLPESTLAITELAREVHHFKLTRGSVVVSYQKTTRARDVCFSFLDKTVTVQGTSFSITLQGTKGTVALREGTLSLANTSNGAAATLTQGFSSDCDSKFSQRDLLPGESRVIDICTPLNEAISARSLDAEKLKVGLTEFNTAIGTLLEEQYNKLTLQDILDKYGKIDKILLYNGYVQRGKILERGKYFVILTNKGITLIEAKNIKHVLVEK